MRHLPRKADAPAGYCECSGGYLEQVWSAILGEPAEAEVLETGLTGAHECVFRIRAKTSVLWADEISRPPIRRARTSAAQMCEAITKTHDYTLSE
jgi:hypothetical protein